MNNPQYFTRRSHLILAIIVAIIVFFILTLVAARMLSDEKPIEDFAPSIIANPSQQPSETPQGQ